jgi:hypothetical protein
MRWFRRDRRQDASGHRGEAASVGPGRGASAPFVCSTCGRTDLPEVGDWDPPICQECDAAINFDAEMEAHDLEGF